MLRRCGACAYGVLAVENSVESVELVDSVDSTAVNNDHGLPELGIIIKQSPRVLSTALSADI